MRNDNTLPSAVVANTIADLSGMLASIGYNDDQIEIAVAFCRRGEDLDRVFRAANGGGRELPSVSYSRRGKTHREERRADFYAVVLRKVVYAAYKRDPESWNVTIALDDDGALYTRALDGDGVKVWRRTYNNTFDALAAEYPDRSHKAATIIFNKSAGGEPGVCFNLDFTADDGGRRAAGLDRGGEQ